MKYTKDYGFKALLASELSHVRVQSRFQIRIYICVCVCGRTSSYMRMLNSSLLGNEKLRGPVVRNVGGVKFRPLSSIVTT